MKHLTYCVLLIDFVLPLNTVYGSTLKQEIIESFSYDIQEVSAFVSQKHKATSREYQHRPLFSRHEAWTELRPDFQLSFSNFDMSAKPRARYEWKQYRNRDAAKTTEDDIDLFINEHLVRFQANDRAFLSWGRENLQWGPGSLFSPSNPFFVDNGRTSPMTEISGKDLIRFTYLADMTWTVSLIANLGKGRWEAPANENFEQSYALKVDYTGEESYAGLVVSHQNATRSAVGGFGGWTISDALLLHTDFSLTTYEGQSDFSHLELLVGGSYTFEAGQTVTLEYARQRNTSDYSRRNKVLMQLAQNDIWNILSIVVQGILNLDDQSSQLITISELSATDHSLFFLNTSHNFGGTGDEFGEFLEHRIQCGWQYTF